MLVLVASVVGRYWGRVAHRVFQAQRSVLLAVALHDLNGVIVVLVVDEIVRDVPHAAEATAANPSFHIGNVCARPDLNPSTVATIGKRNVVDIEIFSDVGHPFVLSKGPDADSVRSNTAKVLNDDVGAVWLERHTIYRVEVSYAS